jgi:hypothetical protein
MTRNYLNPLADIGERARLVGPKCGVFFVDGAHHHRRFVAKDTEDGAGTEVDVLQTQCL